MEYHVHHRGVPRRTVFLRGVFRLAAAFAFPCGLDAGAPSIPMRAAFTQTICGSPSSIFFQLFPSSLDAYNFPLRVPK
jgi:hypothetical protein